MRRAPKRLLAGLLSSAIVLGAPGPLAWQAAAQVREGSASLGGLRALPGAAGAALELQSQDSAAPLPGLLSIGLLPTPGKLALPAAPTSVPGPASFGLETPSPAAQAVPIQPAPAAENPLGAVEASQTPGAVLPTAGLSLAHFQAAAAPALAEIARPSLDPSGLYGAGRRLEEAWLGIGAPRGALPTPETGNDTATPSPLSRPPASAGAPGARPLPGAVSSPAQRSPSRLRGFARLALHRPLRFIAAAVLASVLGMGFVYSNLIPWDQRTIDSLPASDAVLRARNAGNVTRFITEHSSAMDVPVKTLAHVLPGQGYPSGDPHERRADLVLQEQAQAPPAAAAQDTAQQEEAAPIPPEAAAVAAKIKTSLKVDYIQTTTQILQDGKARVTVRPPTVGERIKITVEVTNGSKKPVTVKGLRAVLEETLPFAVELIPSAQAAPEAQLGRSSSGLDRVPASSEDFSLAPGETKSVVFEALPFDAGEIVLSDVQVPVTVPIKGGKSVSVRLQVPEAKFPVASVLPPDLEKPEFKDIAGVVYGTIPSVLWLAALPLGVVLILLSEMFLAARRRYPLPSPRGPGILSETREAVAVLQRRNEEDIQAGRPRAADREFYARVHDVLAGFLIDYHGKLAVRERSARELVRDLKKADVLTAGQLDVAGRLLNRAEAVRDAGTGGGGLEARRGDLHFLSELIESVAGGRPEAGGLKTAAGAPVTGTEGLHAVNPWALWGLVPLAALLILNLLFRGRKPVHVLPSSAELPAKKSLRQRLAWLPKSLQVLTLALMLVTLVRPWAGATRTEPYLDSIDSIAIIDNSGSMSSDDGSGTGDNKLQGAGKAVGAYVIEQRRGTTNRVGLITFSDEAVLDMSLTTDYDAILSHLKELETTGSTAIGRAVIAGVVHFLEANIVELGAKDEDPRIQEVKKLLDAHGLSAALEYAQDKPDLMQKILRPDRKKVMVIFSDGESNTGIEPIDAAKIVKRLNEQYQLGVRIYTVGIAPVDASYRKGERPSSNYSGLDERGLYDTAALTGGSYFRAGDAKSMKEVLLEINSLEKSKVKQRGVPQINEYWMYAAWLMLGVLSLRVVLQNGWLRRFPAFALLLAIPFNQLPAPEIFFQQAATAQAAAAAQGSDSLPSDLRGAQGPFATRGLPRELVKANELYGQGKYGEAVTAYTLTLERYPELVETYLNLGDAFFRMGDPARAEWAWKTLIDTTTDPALQSKAAYNLGNLALAQKDAEGALERYRDALRRHSGNEDAKWNLEVLMRMMKQQQEQENQNQDQKQKKQQQQKQKQKQKQKQQQQKGDQKQKSDQQQKGDQKQKGEPQQSDQQGDQQGEQKEGEKKDGLKELIEEQGKQDKAAEEGAKKAIERKGKSLYAGVPLALGPILAAIETFLKGSGTVYLGTTGIGIVYPVVLVLGAVALPLLAWYLYRGMRKNLKTGQALSPRDAPKRFRDWPGRRGWLARSGLFLAGALLAFIAASGPVKGTYEQRLNFGGKDVYVVGDVSYSTRFAVDGRKERIQRELSDFLNRMQGTDRIGLVLFAGSARTAAYLSAHDYSNFQIKIGLLERESRILPPGSDVLKAVEHAAKSFDHAKKIGERQRVLIIISDGDFQIKGDDKDAVEIAKAAAEVAKTNKLTVYTIGVGVTEEEDPTGEKGRMFAPKAEGEGVEALEDEDGSEARSYLNEEALQVLAKGGGGKYFRTGRDGSIDKILAEVAKLQKGDTPDSIRSPKPIFDWFLWPAAGLLGLELALGMLAGRKSPSSPRGRSPKPESPRPPHGGTRPTGGTGSMFAAGLLGLPITAAWSQILWFAVPTALLSPLIIFEIATWEKGRGGAITRRLRWWWQSRRGLVEKGWAAGVQDHFDVRDVDRERLAAFPARWRAADESGRAALVEEASSDRILWRESLMAAYLDPTNSPSTQGAVLSALSAASRERLDPLDPVAAHLLSRRASSPWLDHPAATRRLARLASLSLDLRRPASRTLLEELARYPDAETSAAARVALAGEAAALRGRWGWGRRLVLAVATALVLSVWGGTGVTVYKALEYEGVRAEMRESNFRVFLGQHDYILRDTYRDPEITDKVLPVLRDWNRRDEQTQARLEKAIETLKKSTDPKSDNILEAIFQGADYLPLTAKADEALLTAMLERENEQVWIFLQEHTAQAGARPEVAARIERMIALGAKHGEEKVFVHLFHFLKSPNPEFQELAAKAIFASLNAPGKTEQFHDRLGKALDRFKADEEINLWAAQFLFQRVAAAPSTPEEGTKTRSMIDRFLEANSWRNDAPFNANKTARLAAIPQALQGQGEVPPAYTARLLQKAHEAIEGAQESSGRVPEPLAGAVLYTADKVAKSLADEADDKFFALKEPLKETGIVKLKRHSQYYTSETYRDHYKLKHLQDLGRLITEAAQNDSAGGPQAMSPEKLEFVNRALTTLGPLAAAGQAAGMLPGGTPGEAVAEELNPQVHAAKGVFEGEAFLQALRAAGLAPDNGLSDEELSYRQSYAADELRKMRGFLIAVAKGGQGWADSAGARRPLESDERLALAETVDAVDAALSKHYAAGAPLAGRMQALQDAAPRAAAAPGAAAPGAALGAAPSVAADAAPPAPAPAQDDLSPAMRPLVAALEGMKAEDPSARTQAESQARQALDSAQSEGLVTVRMLKGSEALAKREGDNRPAQLWLLKDFLTRLPGLPGGIGGEEAGAVFKQLFEAAGGMTTENASEAWAAVQSSYSERTAPEALSPAIQDLVRRKADVLIEKAETAFGGYGGYYSYSNSFKDKLVKEGVRKDNYNTRKVYKETHLNKFLEIVRSEAAALKAPENGSLTEDQQKALAAAQDEVPRLIELGRTTGMLPGNSPEELVAEKINQALYEGYMKFPGSYFYNNLKKNGLASPTIDDPRDLEAGYLQKYSAQDLQKLRKHLLDLRATGKSLDYSGPTSRDISDTEKKSLDDAVSAVDEAIAAQKAGVKRFQAGAALGLASAAQILGGLLSSIPVWAMALGGGLLLLTVLILLYRAVRGPAPVFQDEARAAREDVSVDARQRFQRLDLASMRFADSIFWGPYRSRVMGADGFDQADYREYETGDELKDVDWRQSARDPEGKIQVRRYDQERIMPVILVADLSRSSGRGVGARGRDKREVVEDMAAVVALAAGHRRLPVGLIAVTDEVELFIPPRGSRAHAEEIVRQLLTFQPKSRGTNIKAGLDGALKAARSKGMVVVVSDFLTPSALLRGPLGALAQQHDLRVIRVSDPAELEPLSKDAGLVDIADAETGKVRLIDAANAAVRASHAAAISRREAELDSALREAQIPVLSVSTEGDPLAKLEEHFRSRSSPEEGGRQ